MIITCLRYFVVVFLSLAFCKPALHAQKDLQHQLLEAVEQNELKEIRSLIRQGADVNLGVTSTSPFYMFFLSRDLYMQGLLRKATGEPVYVSSIHANAVKSNIKVLKFLVKKGANIDAGDSKGKTPLMYALRNPGGEEYALELLRRGANYTNKDAAGNTAMHYAAFGGNVQGIHMTAAGGINIDVRNDEGITPLHAAAVRAPLEVMQRMVDLGADINVRDDAGMNVLHYAAGYGDRGKLKWILKKLPSAQELTDDGYSPTDIAKIADNEAAVIFLRRRGGKFNNYMHAELMEAVRQRNAVATKAALMEGANPNRLTEDFPIHIAARNNSPVIIKMLLDFDANPEILDGENKTALDLAFEKGNARAALALLKGGAAAEAHYLVDCMSRMMDPEARPLWLPVLEVLADRSEGLNLAGGVLGTPPLHYAAYLGMEDVVETLLKAGADPAKADPDGWTALHWAVMKADLQSSHPEKVRIARSLLAYGAPVNAPAQQPKSLPHTAPYLARRVPAGATPLDISKYALPPDRELDTLLLDRGGKSLLAAENYVENGRQLLQEGDYRTAMMEFNRAVGEDPEHAPSYEARGLCKMALSMFQEAQRDFEVAEQLDPRMASAVFHQGRSQFEQMQYAAAAKQFDRAMQLGHDRGECLYWRGKSRLRQQDRKGACKDFKLAIDAGYQQAAMAQQLYCN